MPDPTLWAGHTEEKSLVKDSDTILIKNKIKISSAIGI